MLGFLRSSTLRGFLPSSSSNAKTEEHPEEPLIQELFPLREPLVEDLFLTPYLGPVRRKIPRALVSLDNSLRVISSRLNKVAAHPLLAGTPPLRAVIELIKSLETTLHFVEVLSLGMIFSLSLSLPMYFSSFNFIDSFFICFNLKQIPIHLNYWPSCYKRSIR